jgi:hypothetical protein
MFFFNWTPEKKKHLGDFQNTDLYVTKHVN